MEAISVPITDVMQTIDDINYEESQLFRNERIEIVYKKWMSEKNDKSQRKIARQYDFSSSTLNDRINDDVSQTERNQNQQHVWSSKEAIIVEIIKRLQVWNWFARIQHVRFMIEQLFEAKDDTNSLNKRNNHLLFFVLIHQ